MDNRIENLRTLLKENSLDAVLISSLPNIIYLSGYTGFHDKDRDGYLLITQNNQYIFTNSLYSDDVKNKVKNFSLIMLNRDTPFSKALSTIISELSLKKIGFESFDLRVSEFERLQQHLDKQILKPANLLTTLRLYKSSDEIESLQKACTIGDDTFAFISQELKEGMTEKEVAALMEFFIKKAGADISFTTIVAFEENTSYPHHVPTNKKLQKENFILMDFGVLLNGYCSDMTRTISFGKATTQKKNIYKTVLTAQTKAVTYIEKQLQNDKPISGSDADKAARDYILSAGFQSIPHSLGHGIGLEVHENPRLTSSLNDYIENGMVFSIEPGIYLPDRIGVRIEDLFAIKENTLIKLTNSSNNLIEL